MQNTIPPLPGEIWGDICRFLPLPTILSTMTRLNRTIYGAALYHLTSRGEELAHLIELKNSKGVKVGACSDPVLYRKICDYRRDLYLQKKKVKRMTLCHFARNCPNVERIFLANAKLSFTDLDIACSQFKNLTALDISKTNSSDETLSFLYLAKKLSTLVISYNVKIRGGCFSSLPASLTSLTAEDCNIHNRYLFFLARFSLVQLNLSFNSISNIFEFPTSLQVLKLASTEIADEAFPDFIRLTALRELNIKWHGENIWGCNLHLLPLSLQTLDVRDCSISKSALHQLRRLTNLQELRISFMGNCTILLKKIKSGYYDPNTD